MVCRHHTRAPHCFIDSPATVFRWPGRNERNQSPSCKAGGEMGHAGQLVGSVRGSLCIRRKNNEFGSKRPWFGTPQTVP